MVERFNYRHNKRIPLKDNTVINGQGVGLVALMKYGFFPMSYNGCEIIALHNSAVLLGRESCLREAVREMYPKCQSFSGLLGSNPYLLFPYYKKRNIKYRMTLSYTDFFDSLDRAPVAVISFWNPPSKPFHGIHTVTIQKIDGKIRIYNRYNNRDYPYEYETRKDFMPKKSDFICGYLIEEKED